ncbi:MAG: NUDIX hydrolase [Stagnimonas sp.]|nr:NUDIX hydrolase [Stagnimonas sp.]
MSKPRPWMPHVTVATVVERNGRFLLIEEEVNGDTVINQPAGHWEEGETFMQAAVRETLEETGWKVEITGLVGIYEYKPPELDYAFVRFAFSAKPIEHDPNRVLDEGIRRWFWMNQNELRQEIYRHRSPMVQQCVEDYWTVKRWPLSLITHQTPFGEETSNGPHGDDDELSLRKV